MSKLDVSIIIPAYNEVNNISRCIDQILEFRLKSPMNIEIILIESGSTDGTHEIAEEFKNKNLTNFAVFYEDKPQGKGSACKVGIQKSSGKVICIFDADNEYDIEDLPKLASPILMDKEKFVLGSRHSEGPMRTFTQSRIHAAYFNFGHHIFTAYFNLLFRTKLKDPATMWKVVDGKLARDIHFTGSRFDFDWEILAYLIRLGYVPKELAISYKSRSPNEGKKIKPIADPIHWIYKITIFRTKKIRYKNQA